MFDSDAVVVDTFIFLGYDSTDCAIREEILGQLRDMEWQNRVNDAREEFVRMEGNGR